VSCEVATRILSEWIFIYFKRHYSTKHEKTYGKYHEILGKQFWKIWRVTRPATSVGQPGNCPAAFSKDQTSKFQVQMNLLTKSWPWQLLIRCTSVLISVFPPRKFYTEQIIVSVRMQLCNHPDAQPVKMRFHCANCLVILRICAP